MHGISAHIGSVAFGAVKYVVRMNRENSDPNESERNRNREQYQVQDIHDDSSLCADLPYLTSSPNYVAFVRDLHCKSSQMATK